MDGFGLVGSSVGVNLMVQGMETNSPGVRQESQGYHRTIVKGFQAGACISEHRPTPTLRASITRDGSEGLR